MVERKCARQVLGDCLGLCCSEEEGATTMGMEVGTTMVYDGGDSRVSWRMVFTGSALSC